MMTKTFRAVAACLIAAGLAVTASASPAVADNNKHAGLQRVLEQTVKEDGLPGIIADVRDGRDRWFSTVGVADTGNGRKRRQQDRFRAGSVTKSFTATVVLKLVGEGRLSLDDTVEKWLPGLVRGNGNDGSKITVRQLLNQTSGLFPYTMDNDMAIRYFTPAFLERRYDAYRPEELVRFAVRNPPSFAPGTGWGYSNTNFTLAGLIIEKVTGNDYADEVARRITRPLGLTSTYLPGNETKLRGPHARHYSTIRVTGPDAKVHDATDMNASWGWAAGDIVSSAGDLHTFYRALLGGRLLPPAQQKELFQAVSTEGVPWIDNTAYGLGIFAQKLSCGVTVWGNGGFIHGSWTYAMGSKDGRHMVVTNINGDWGNPIGVFTKEMEAEMCGK